jgi:ribosomal protein L30/L7E
MHGSSVRWYDLHIWEYLHLKHSIELFLGFVILSILRLSYTNDSMILCMCADLHRLSIYAWPSWQFLFSWIFRRVHWHVFAACSLLFSKRMSIVFKQLCNCNTVLDEHNVGTSYMRLVKKNKTSFIEDRPLLKGWRRIADYVALLWIVVRNS